MKGFDLQVAAILGFLHFALIGFVVYWILSSSAPDWSMYWMLPLQIDVPAAAIWLLVSGISWLAFRTRPDSLPTDPRPRHIPFHAWLAFLVLAAAGILQLATFAGAQMGHASDGRNFIAPLAACGGLGTFLVGDAGRVIAATGLRFLGGR